MTIVRDTLKNLNVKVGDVVQYMYGSYGPYTIENVDGILKAKGKGGEQFVSTSTDPSWYVISRAVQEPKLWKDMTPEEKGALLLAHHEGKTIEFDNSHIAGCGWRSCKNNPLWTDNCSYRIKPEPKVETREIVLNYGKVTGLTHRITYNLIDGEPDCSSAKMQRI